MQFREITPGPLLQPYIKHYYLFESDSSAAYTDTVFPGGTMEMIFNLGDGIWQFSAGDRYHTTAQVELWGQLTKPLPIRSAGRHCMLGIRFYPHTAALFLNEELPALNDQVTDLGDVLGEDVRVLHGRLRETPLLQDRIGLIEGFLLRRIAENEGHYEKVNFVQQLLQDIKTAPSVHMIASRYHISPRYVHKLVFKYTGLSPIRYGKIERFQRSLQLLQDRNSSLTDIAYDCGYFDQAHFIKDFKSFTGQTPSAFRLITSK